MRREEVRAMEINELVNIFVNNGIAIAVIIYFMFRDMKFMNKLTESIQELKDSVKEVTKIYEKRGGE